MTNDADQTIGLYRRHAQAWVARRGTDLAERAWLDRFLAILPDAPAVLDIGCGFGEPIGRYLLQAGCDVTGVDASPELIAIARDRMPEANWILADMRELQIGSQFHGVLAWNSMFHLRQQDQRGMFAIFQRHAAPGAALMFTTGPAEGEALGEFEGEVLYHASLSPEAYRSLLDQHGFDLVAHVVEDPECCHLTVWLAQFRGAD